MRIQNTSGQYWTGECWGARQAAAEYVTYEDLPLELDDGDRSLTRVIHSTPHRGGYLDVRYYDPDGDLDPVAAAVQ